ncbi:uncharacterized protein LOC100262793 isoform X1 [Vitis vinifera]|uniref:uncharacterized protein LOC100262793 isoform X1 n=1 Tax=Vitis vinifera TaxID=29760 RepID=UPI0028832403|nr:uncharacterized protein LOC100262793 isoform X1 [Vitis vinifera]
MMKGCAMEQSSTYAACEEMIMMMGSVSVVCPKPRRLGLFNNDHIPPRRWHMHHDDSKDGSELLDIILAKVLFCSTSLLWVPFNDDVSILTTILLLITGIRKIGPPGGFISTIFLWVTAEQSFESRNPRRPIRERKGHTLLSGAVTSPQTRWRRRGRRRRWGRWCENDEIRIQAGGGED